MRIAVYTRVSTSRQQQTHTIDQQLDRLRAYVALHADWRLAEEHIFCDMGARAPSSSAPDSIICATKRPWVPSSACC